MLLSNTFVHFPGDTKTIVKIRPTRSFQFPLWSQRIAQGSLKLLPRWSQVASLVIPFINTHWLCSRMLAILIIKSLVYV